MSTKIDTKGQLVVRATELIAGTSKHLTNATNIALLGSSFTPAEVTTKLQSLVTLRNDVNTAKAATRAKVTLEAASRPALRTFLSAYVTFLKAAYGSTPDVLADFGIRPKVRVPLTVEAKAAATAKRAATRAARHTMGTNQKKVVKGDVAGVVVTPIHAPPPIAPTLVTPGPTMPTTPAPSGAVPVPKPAG
jgi:hypothetical protein